jgi:hypothetical protein
MSIFDEEFHMPTDMDMNDDWGIVLDVVMEILKIVFLEA